MPFCVLAPCSSERKGVSFCSRASVSWTETIGDSSQQFSACLFQRAGYEKRTFSILCCNLGWRFSLLPLVEGGLEKEHLLWSPSCHEEGQSRALVELSQAGESWLPPIGKVPAGQGCTKPGEPGFKFCVGRGGNIPFQDTLVSGKGTKSHCLEPQLVRLRAGAA